MPTKEINLSGTLNTEDDEFHIGFNGFTELINLRQQNGKLIQRYGTGSPTTVSTADIDNIEMFVDRRLTGVKIDTGSSTVTLTNSSKTLSIASIASGTLIPGYDNDDLRNVFKAGDTVYIQTPDGQTNPGGMFTISSVTNDDLVFTKSFVADETISSGDVYISFPTGDSSTSLGEEMITNTVDREAGSGSNWVNASSSNAFNTWSDNYTTGIASPLVSPVFRGQSTSATAANKYATLANTHWPNLVTGKRYRLSFILEVSTYTDGTFSIGMMTSTTPIAGKVKTYTATLTARRQSIDFVATASCIRIGMHWSSGGEGSFEVDNFSLKEIKQTGLTIEDDNSFDGKAWVTTSNNSSNKVISLVNKTDYTDKVDLKEFSTGLTDHIRIEPQTDAVRFPCGFDNSPHILKYVDRHPFNGMLKEYITTSFERSFQGEIDHLFPHWVCEPMTPTIDSSAIQGTTFSNMSEVFNRINSLRGSLNHKNNTYKYKVVPIIDGNQELSLEDSVFNYNTSKWPKTVTNDEGIITNQDGACALEMSIDMAKYNLRISGFNIYRSTNNGPYYRIKTIYGGENDITQKTHTFHGENQTFWWIGDTEVEAATLDSNILYYWGTAVTTDNGTGATNVPYSGVGANSIEVPNNSLDITSRGSSYYQGLGNSAAGTRNKCFVFNKESESTDPIYANNGEAIGGSPDGGWYFGGTNLTEYTTSAGTTDLTVDGGEINASPLSDDDNPLDITTTDFEVRDGSSNKIGWNFGNDSATKTDSIGFIEITSTSGNLTDGTTYNVSGWVKAVNFNSPNSEWRLFLSQDDTITDTASTGDVLIAEGSGGAFNQNIDEWRYFQFEFTASSTNELYLYVRINVADSLDKTGLVKISNLAVSTQAASGFRMNQGLRGFGGEQIGVGDSSFSDESYIDGILKGNRIVNTTHSDYPSLSNSSKAFSTTVSDVIRDNTGSFILCGTRLPGNDDSFNNIVCNYSTSNYQFYSEASTAVGYNQSLDGVDGDGSFNSNMRLLFIDTGLPDGPRHPYELAESTDVKYKFATMLNGRQFVGNVKITSEEQTEERTNFILFSEPNSPDVIPVTNFIQLQDLQGGEIIGMETLMSDLVVFMTNGIFRLSVPSNNPSSWSLVEAHENVGPIHDRAIVKTSNGIFFVSTSGVYYLDSGFTLTPISDPLRTGILNNTDTQAERNIVKLHHNVKYDLLYMIASIVSTITIMYVYDLKRGVWYQETHGTVDNGGYDLMALDDEGNSILVESNTNSQIRKLHDTSEYRDKGSVAISWSMKTGKQILNTLDFDAIIRRVNTIVTNNASATDSDLEVTTNNGTTTKSNFLDGIQSTRVSRRGKWVQIKISAGEAEDYETQINHVDVEYE